MYISTVPSGGSSSTPVQEAPAGAIDGANSTYTLSQTPTSPASLKIHLNGLLQVNGTDYTLAGTTVTMSAAPLTGDILMASYSY